MSEQSSAATYHCRECGSENVDVTPSPVDSTKGHVHCQNEECGWIFRNVRLDRMVK